MECANDKRVHEMKSRIYKENCAVNSNKLTQKTVK